MRFSVHEFYRENPGTFTAPFRLRDPATGKIIDNVIGFDTETDTVSILCVGGDGQKLHYVDYDKREESLVAQDIVMPFEIADYYAGIDDEPKINVQTIIEADGKIVGEWTPPR